VFKERELVKIKWAEKWQPEELLWDSFIETIKLKHSGAKNNPLLSMKVHYKLVRLDCLIIQP